ncbi:replication factor C, activator 1, putative [Ichthyophthirius multifiliis]|uniref:Replication factor C, activator 1, putative n=1 Tax=Ichthyophthirius multifiliis TaxID=5932 RepID=G0QW84_ICHMU|nr:replication factor C, activator 1, putative [Ichthyophthirius multifiliis]EGR30507.1 replication factor C, activator 1, putative [Ichthyophthirius multifiliis]|eukprot:XP_004032094.1 replication factor C, activator 1, putative [Ichthyophthirius multifiliis]
MDKLWVDQYRPKQLSQLDYHEKLTETLKSLAHSEDFPHLLFYGPNGAGKKTRIMSFLHEVYGNGVHKIKAEEREFKVSSTSSATCEINIIYSNYHIDVTPADAEVYDRVIIQKLIKEVASTHQLDPTSQKSFKVVILNEVDRLTLEAQASLRRTMEKYVNRCRLILCCENIGRVIQPLRSRCLLIRVPAPDEGDIIKVVKKIQNQENLPNISEEICRKMGDGFGRNLRDIILNLQMQKLNKSAFDGGSVKSEWKKEIGKIAQGIKDQQSPFKLKEIRGQFYDLLVNCIPGDVIIKQLMQELIGIVNNNFIQQEFIYWAAYHENQMNKGSKTIFHLEAFVAQCMLVYKKYITQNKN